MSKRVLKSVHTINWGKLIFLLSMMLTTIVSVPIYVCRGGFSVFDAVFLVFFIFSTGLTVAVGYHRLFSHAAFKAHPIVTFLCLFFGAAALENSAIRWAAQHRDHHRYVDHEGDPYNIKEGFFHAHMGWIFFRVQRYHYRNVRDLLKSKLIKHQHRYYFLWASCAGILLPMATGMLTGDPLKAFLLYVVAKITIVQHGTFVINSVCHYFGKPTYDPLISARDFWPAAFLTYGEGGHHSFHHRFPSDYRSGIHWYDWDPVKWTIALLGQMGLAWDLRRASDQQILEAKLSAEKKHRGFAGEMSGSLQKGTLFLFIFLFSIGGAEGFCQGEMQREPLKVAASIFSLADMVRQIGGDQVEAVTILPSGGNPHIFELSPGKVSELQGARIIFAIGHGFDDWLRSTEESFSGAHVITVDSGVDFIGGDAVDPHYWLSLRNARQIAENIARELLPMVSKKETVEANLKRYLEQLSETDRRIEALFSDLNSRKMVTAHNAWAYFARDYGLEILGSIESRGHGEPTPKHLTALGKLVRREGVRALFIQPQIQKDIIQAFAEDFHLRIYKLDPIESSREGESYAEQMLQNARIIHEALQI